MSVTYTNLDRAFIESEDLENIRHLPDPEYDHKRIINSWGNINIFKNSNFFVNIKPGFQYLSDIRKDTEVINNDLIVNMSKKEMTHVNDNTKLSIYPYNDDNEKEENKRISLVIKKPVTKNYGKVSEENIRFKNKVYHDNNIKHKNVVDQNNVLISTLLSQDEDEFKDSFIINEREFDFRGASIDVLGRIEELKRSSIIDIKIKGISCDIISSGKDIRNRSLNVENSINIINTNTIESYSDISSNEHVFDGLQRFKNFEFTEIDYNGSRIYFADFTINNAIKEVTPNELIYLSYDENNIFPFVDYSYVINDNTFLEGNERYKLSGELYNHYKNNQNSYNMKSNSEDYIDGYLYNSVGYDIDYSQSIGIDSISYIGVLD